MAIQPAELGSGFSGDPWSQQPGESARAFLAFTHYRDLGHERSQAKADENYRAEVDLPPKDPKTLPTKQIAEWSRQHRWVERCAAYDDHLDAMELEQHRRQRVRMATRQAARAAKAATALSYPMELFLDRMEKINGGQPSDLHDLSDEDLLRLARHAISLVPDMHKAERDALASTDATAPKAERVRLRGEVLRRIISAPDLFGAFEETVIDVTADEEPVTLVTGEMVDEKNPPED